ncbi:MAG: hypothetical protein IKU25_08535 [Clostridia bacterium]|nr:hypothetical protein [Clostridia bacterium]
MNNCKKKTTIVTVIFCILLILGIVLSLAVDLNIPSREANKVRDITITFTGTLKSNTLQTALEEKIEGAVVLNEKDKIVTTTTTTKATTTTKPTTTTTTTAATTTTTAGTTDTNASTTAAATTTTTTKPTTTTTVASASDFKSGKAVATVSKCDEKSDEDLRKIFEEVFASKDFKNNNLVIVEINEVEAISGLNGTQIYACVILLIVVFVFCLIRFYSLGALASAVSVVISAAVAIAASIGAALICNTFANIDVSGVAAVAAAACAVFAAIVLENVKNGTKNETCSVSGIAAVVSVLLVLVAIVSVIAWNGEIAFSCIQYALAIIISAISALVYVRCVFDKFAPEKTTNNKKKGSSKKPVIK